MPGKFITFEGPDGAGKTTQMRLAGEKLAAGGYEVVYTREPGGTPISEQIRQILLDPANGEMADKTEALLYAAARAQHVKQLIWPAVEAGKVVLCDRFTDSTLAYQGYGRGIDRSLLRLVNDMAVGEMVPDLTVILDLNPETGLNRITQTRCGQKAGMGRIKEAESGPIEAGGGHTEAGKGHVAAGKDRIEQENIDFHRRVRDGFLALARENPRRYRVVAADRELAAVADEVWRCIQEVFGFEDP